VGTFVIFAFAVAFVGGVSLSTVLELEDSSIVAEDFLFQYSSPLSVDES